MSVKSSCYVFMLMIVLIMALAVSVMGAALNDAKSAYDSGDYAAAIDLFQQHFDSLPSSDADAVSSKSKAFDLLQIGKCKQSLRQYDQARATLSMLITNFNVDSDISAEAQYLIGCTFKEEDNLNLAVQALNEVAIDYPDNGAWCSTALLLKGECQKLSKEYANASQTYQSIITRYPSKKGICLAAKMGLVQTAMEAGRIGGKAAMWHTLEKILVDYKSDSEIQSYANFIKSRYGNSDDLPDFAEAAVMFRAQSLDDGKPLDMSNMSNMDMKRLADQYYARDNYPRALEVFKYYYQTACDCDLHEKCRQHNASVMLNIGKCHMKLRDYENVRTSLLPIISKYPDDTDACLEAYMLIAKSYEKENKKLDAISTYEQIYTSFPDKEASCANALLSKAKLQQILRMNDCVATYQTLINNYPNEYLAKVDGKIGYAIALACSEQVDLAISTIDQLCESDLLSRNQKVGLLFWKATTQIKAKQLAAYNETLNNISTNYSDLKTECRKGKLELATVLVHIGENEQASLILNEISNDTSYTHGERVSIVLLTGFINMKTNPTKAEDAMSIVISDYGDLPECQQAYMHRAILRTKRGAYAGAASDIQMIKVPCWKYYAEGEYYYAQAKYSEAIASFSQVYPNYKAGEMPEDVSANALSRLLQCYKITGESVKEEEVYEQLEALFSVSAN